MEILFIFKNNTFIKWYNVSGDIWCYLAYQHCLGLFALRTCIVHAREWIAFILQTHGQFKQVSWCLQV